MIREIDLWSNFEIYDQNLLKRTFLMNDFLSFIALKKKIASLFTSEKDFQLL